MNELHPDTVRFLQVANRPDLPPYHTLPLEMQRLASARMHQRFRLEAPAVASAEDGLMSRHAEAGGPLRYRLYRPLGIGANDVLPALIYFHGGGWTVGDLDSYDVLCRELANGAGCAVLSLDYRLAPEQPFPAAVDDALFAARWLAKHAADLQVDAERIALGGDSAGGNLAAVTALQLRDGGGPQAVLQLLIYPATDQRGIAPSHRQYANGFLLTQATIRHFQEGYLPDAADRLDWRASPLLAESLAGLPAALVLTASHDPLVDDGRAYAQRLQQAGVMVTYREYAGVIHGFFSLGKAFVVANEAVAEAAAALRTAFSGTAPR